MWLGVFVTVIAVGAAFTVIYKVYYKIDHPLLIKIAGKITLDFFIDTLGLMIQFASMPTFRDKASFSAGSSTTKRCYTFISNYAYATISSEIYDKSKNVICQKN